MELSVADVDDDDDAPDAPPDDDGAAAGGCDGGLHVWLTTIWRSVGMVNYC